MPGDESRKRNLFVASISVLIIVAAITSTGWYRAHSSNERLEAAADESSQNVHELEAVLDDALAKQALEEMRTLEEFRRILEVRGAVLANDFSDEETNQVRLVLLYEGDLLRSAAQVAAASLPGQSRGLAKQVEWLGHDLENISSVLVAGLVPYEDVRGEIHQLAEVLQDLGSNEARDLGADDAIQLRDLRVALRGSATSAMEATLDVDRSWITQNDGGFEVHIRFVQRAPSFMAPLWVAQVCEETPGASRCVASHVAAVGRPTSVVPSRIENATLTMGIGSEFVEGSEVVVTVAGLWNDLVLEDSCVVKVSPEATCHDSKNDVERTQAG